MTFMKNDRFNTFVKGRAMINFVITCTIGFALNKNSAHLKNGGFFLKDDLLACGAVLMYSLAFAILFGIISGFIFARVESIRSTPISEILFIFFSTYLLACIGFFNQSWDYTSEELSVLFFGIFCSHYTRYNLSIKSARRLR
jgi:hypothetical protein